MSSSAVSRPSSPGASQFRRRRNLGPLSSSEMSNLEAQRPQVSLPLYQLHYEHRHPCERVEVAFNVVFGSIVHFAFATHHWECLSKPVCTKAALRAS